MFTSNIVLFNLLHDPSISDEIVYNQKEGPLIGEQMTRGVSSDPSVGTYTDTFVSSGTLAENPASIPTAPRNMNSHFTQGSDVGNCVGVSNLTSFAQYEEGLEYLNSLVKKDENNNYVVSFPNKEPITIDRSIIERYDAVRGNDYIEAITFALYEDAGFHAYIAKRPDNMRGLALNEANTFQCLTGMEQDTCEGTFTDLARIEDAMKSGKKLIMQTGFKDGVQSVTNGRVFPEHAFTLLSADTQNNVVQLANPWYDSNDEIISMSIEDFQEYTNGIHLLEMKTDNGKTSFSSSNIGINVDPSIIDNYQPTKDDYLAYWKDNYFDDNTFDEGFWEALDNNGYEAYKKNEYKLTPDIEENMPIYSALKKEGFSPSALVKQYMETQTIPEFKDEILQGKSDDIKNWIIKNYQGITHLVQVNLYQEQKTINDARIGAEIEARRESDEAARIQYNENFLTEFQNEALAPIPEATYSESAVFPNDYENDYKGLPLQDNANGNKYIRYGNEYGGFTTITFDTNGRILSQETSSKNGEINESLTYTYKDNGVRITQGTNLSGQTILRQEVFDQKGNLSAIKEFNNNSLTTKVYITSPSGERLNKTSSLEQLSESSGRYSRGYMERYDSEYEFYESGSVKTKKNSGFVRDDNKVTPFQASVYEYAENGDELSVT